MGVRYDILTAEGVSFQAAPARKVPVGKGKTIRTQRACKQSPACRKTFRGRPCLRLQLHKLNLPRMPTGAKSCWLRAHWPRPITLLPLIVSNSVAQRQAILPPQTANGGCDSMCCPGRHKVTLLMRTVLETVPTSAAPLMVTTCRSRPKSQCFASQWPWLAPRPNCPTHRDVLSWIALVPCGYVCLLVGRSLCLASL